MGTLEFFAGAALALAAVSRNAAVLITTMVGILRVNIAKSLKELRVNVMATSRLRCLPYHSHTGASPPRSASATLSKLPEP